ncbi:MAG: MYXO-CTERM sorting domain-containing protein [Myxococcales bacterium]
MSSAPGPRHRGVWAFAAGLILALQLRRHRRACLGMPQGQSRICHAVTPF